MKLQLEDEFEDVLKVEVSAKPIRTLEIEDGKLFQCAKRRAGYRTRDDEKGKSKSFVSFTRGNLE